MIAVYPLVATIGAAVNVTMVTYDGKAFIGVSTDDRAIGDHADLMHALRAGFHSATLTGAPLYRHHDRWGLLGPHRIFRAKEDSCAC